MCTVGNDVTHRQSVVRGVICFIAQSRIEIEK